MSGNVHACAGYDFCREASGDGFVKLCSTIALIREYKFDHLVRNML